MHKKCSFFSCFSPEGSYNDGDEGGYVVRRLNNDMLRGPLLGNLIYYTVPIMLTGILQLLFNAADLVVVGQFRGSLSVAAVGATGALINLIVNLFFGMSVGAGVTVAHGIGSQDDQRVHRTVHTALAVALVCGVILTIVGVTFCEQFLIWMGTPEDVLPLSATYMRIYFYGMTFNIVYNFCASMLRAAGDTKSPLIYLAIAGVVNVLLNLLFVVVFGMNVEGVAIATIISQGISAALVVLALRHRTDACKLSLRKIRFYKPQLLKIMRIGLPAGIQSTIFSMSNVMIQSSINSFGEAVMTGNAAAGNLEGFVYVSMNSFSQTAVNFTGQNVGARQYERVKKIFWQCFACVAICGICLSSLIYSFGPSLLGIYITDSAEAIQSGMIRFQFACLPYFLCGMMEVCSGVLRGMGVSTLPMITSILGVCGIRIGWILTVFQIPEFHTPQCLYFSYPISWIFTTAIHMICFLVIYRKRVKHFATP